MIASDIQVRWLGTVPYRDALAVQLETHRAVVEHRSPDTLLLLQHPPVYTLGKRGDQGGFLLTREEIGRRGAEIVATDRGGLLTFHGPGQLVGYPILALDERHLSLRCYVDVLMQALARVLKSFGVDAAVDASRPGVYVQGRKIASVGVRLSEGVTRHGFAVNLTTDLSWFDAIVPCGLHGVKATSLQAETGTSPTPEKFGRAAAAELEAGLRQKQGKRSETSCRT